MASLVWIVLGVLAIVAVTAWSPRVSVAPHLILLLIGVGVSLLPCVPPIAVDPELILVGVLPPLLYSSAVNVPTTDFRRDLRTISALSVVLVLFTAVLVGWVVSLLIPGLGVAAGISLGAIVAPTDAVATRIVRTAGVSPRIVTVLEGESLLNDATALVLLRTATAAIFGTIALGGVIGGFAWAVLGAVLIGWVVGEINLQVQYRLQESAAGVALSIVVPFAAFLPAEHLGASGLVAAVVAGLVTGHGSISALRPQDRLTNAAFWSTAEFVLEGGVFLVMGLELAGLVGDLRSEQGSLRLAVVGGVVAATMVVVIRLLFLAGFVKLVQVTSQARAPELVVKLHQIQGQLEDPQWLASQPDESRMVRRKDSMTRRVTRKLADLDYFAAEPFGPPEVAVLTWAGMRGVVTLAAAQTLPDDTPERPLLILIAFVVAAGTLLVQGSTLPALVRRLGLGGRDEGPPAAARRELGAELSDVALTAVESGSLRRANGDAFDETLVTRYRRMAAALAEAPDEFAGHAAELTELRLALIGASRTRLAELRTLGTYSSEVLAEELARLDADELSLRMTKV